ncbi:hypothetical protein [Streptomyces sp. NPDC007905]|uniref:hypothetical protein n=1 Tax=Streptomyces sp. NPDC007905 TaxID=3364788 RepID=UPI0036ED03E7
MRNPRAVARGIAEFGGGADVRILRALSRRSFFSPYLLPIPRHITVGVRRRAVNPEDLAQAFSFEDAPIKLSLHEQPKLGAIVESLFFRSPSDVTRDSGLTFALALFLGDDLTAQNALTIGLGENYTLRAGYRRDYSPVTGLPKPPLPGTIDAWLHHEIAVVEIDIMAVTAGYAIGKAVRGATFGDCFELTADIFIYVPPFGDETAFFKFRSLNGERVAFGLEGIGYKQGALSLTGFSAPDGVVIFFGPVGVIIEEFGVVAESGTSYVSFSGGVKVEPPAGFKGGVTFRRLRFRLRGGDASAPPFKLDGFFIFFKNAAVEIEAGGYYREEQEGQTRIREFGLTGTVGFDLEATSYLFGLDLVVGEVASPTETFGYLMAQVFFKGSVPCSLFELHGARVLFGRNMQPKLEAADRDAQQLRYFNWYNASNPLTVPGDRRLAAWRSQRGTVAVGVGVNATISGLSKALELGLFVLVLVGEDERGFLIGDEVFALGSTEPLGYLALEWDGKSEHFSVIIGIDLTAENFVKNPPEFLKTLVKLTGTLFICNDPGTVAIGRLADQRTWLGLRFDVGIAGSRMFLLVAACFEYVDRPEGPKGFGLVLRAEGAANYPGARLEFHAAFGVLYATFTTGSSDYAALIFIELGLRIVLFGLRLGIEVRAEWRAVGSSPRRSEIKLEIRLETPWFFPDFTFTFEHVFGRLAPAELSSSASPLRSAGALAGGAQKTHEVHVARADAAWDGLKPTRPLSIVELRAASPAEAARLQAFAADATAQPIATDATINVDWAVPITDKLALNTLVASAADQQAGDLQLRYELVGMSVRRRPRFGASRPWALLEQRTELTADFTDSAGVALTGAFGPQVLAKFWDVDIRVDGAVAAKRLLINASTPFDFRTRDPAGDETLVSQHPTWPCCPAGPMTHQPPPPYRPHLLTFNQHRAGTVVRRVTFSESTSTAIFPAAARVRRQRLDAYQPTDLRVAVITAEEPGVLVRAVLNEDAASAEVTLAVPLVGYTIRVQAQDAAGHEVATAPVTTQGMMDSVMLHGTGPIRCIEVIAVGVVHTTGDSTDIPAPQNIAIELWSMAYVALDDYLSAQLAAQACAPGPMAQALYEGRGKLSFLPNHEYELAFKTRVTITHPTAGAESADVDEYVLFRSKGLPGLNAVGRVGEELEPYVRATYTGGHGRLYREEPIAIAFREDFHVAVPITLRPPGTSAEHTQLLRMQLLARPDNAPTTGTLATSSGEDWIVTHRPQQPASPQAEPWDVRVTSSSTLTTLAKTDDAARVRLGTIVAREKSRCPLNDPRTVIGPVLLAPPQGDNDLWPEVGALTATVVRRDAGFVERQGFISADLGAFQFTLDEGTGGADDWSLDGPCLHASSNGRRYALFGEADWDHLNVRIGVELSGAMAGVGFGLPSGASPSRGLFAVVEATPGGRRLVIYRRRSGTQLELLQAADLPPHEADTSLTLTVVSFDDRLRATAGGVTVEADREELREGQLCLFAGGEARFSSLAVTGLELYRFSVPVSAFASFTDHIHSFGGRVATVVPDALGPGTSTSTVTALWASTGARVQAVMHPSAAAADRQVLFERWARELGLPFQDELTELAVSELADAGRGHALVLESPEPLDLVEEVSVTLAKRVVASIAPETASEIVRQPAGFSPLATRHPRVIGLVTEVVHEDDALRAEFDPQRVSRLPASIDAITFVEATADAHGRHFRIYAAPIDESARASASLVAPLVDVLDSEHGGEALLPEGAKPLEPGDVVAITAGHASLIAKFPLMYTFEDIPLAALQNATGRRAILVPLDAQSATDLPPGTYRLTFTMHRRRWPTVQAPDTLNCYSRTVSLTLSL